ncbi:apolipoprotein N-acyltransferase [uncultured Actinomyces sp.]|uniref:apolipoprotein N-acyltransferase n=1 Tax=uncultured Actinomyces sp. TaxID=249061 RepID=UPI0026081E11|nr:apolipoprotein N-acyltransferase [uncultured Actinomyces sp.]
MSGYLPKRRRLLDYAQILVAAVLMWASFPDLAYWFLIFPSVILLVSALDRSRAGRATWYGFVFGLGFFLPHIWWATVSVGSYLPWLALATVQALFLALFGLSVAWVRQISALQRSPFLYALCVGVLWVAVEQLRGRVPFGGFPWGYIAYSQVDSPLRTLAPWGSEVAIGLVVVTSCVLVRRAFGFVPAFCTSPIRRVGAVAIATLIVVMPFALTLDARAEGGSLRVGVIQGNIELPADATFAQYLKVTKNHVQTTEEALVSGTKADIILWGENSMDHDPRSDAKAKAMLDGVAKRAGVPIVVGVLRYEDDARWNEAVVWYPDGSVGEVYTKQLPVPFGEYIPMREYLSILSKETAKVSTDMLPGTEPGVMNVDLAGRQLTMGVGICFEAAYERIFSEAAQLGAQMLFVPTNNSSFGYTPESTQQLQMVRLRAMSMSRTAMQVSTNGVSAIVRPNGTMLKVTDLYQPDWIVEDVPLRTSLTFSAKWGEYLNYTVMTLGGLLLFVGFVRTVSRRREIGYAR